MKEVKKIAERLATELTDELAGDQSKSKYKTPEFGTVMGEYNTKGEMFISAYDDRIRRAHFLIRDFLTKKLMQIEEDKLKRRH